MLWIGNSFTYYNNMPEMVKAIAISSGKDINYDKHLKGGKTWEYHANEKVSYVF